MKTEVWYCKDKVEFATLMLDLHKQRPDLTWRFGLHVLDISPDVIPAWIIIQDNELSRHDDLGETSTQELNTAFLVNHKYMEVELSDIHYHTTKP